MTLDGSRCTKEKLISEDRAGNLSALPHWRISLLNVLSSIYLVAESPYFCWETQLSSLQVPVLIRAKQDICFIIKFPLILQFFITILKGPFGNNGTMILLKIISKKMISKSIFFFWVCSSTYFLKIAFEKAKAFPTNLSK